MDSTDTPTSRTDTIEGFVGDGLWYHYDVGNDVLYVRFIDARDVETLGEETDDGLTLHRDASNDRVVGLTVIYWWKRFGDGGPLPDSLKQIEAAILPVTSKVAA